MRVKSLYRYPVKSLAGISVSSLPLDDFGPVGDRRWMIVDDNQMFVTQRSHPELAKVGTEFDDQEQVRINIPGEGAFTLTPQTEQCSVTVWRDTVSAVYGAPEAAAALSRYCGKALFLVYMPDDSFRRVDEERVPEYRRVSFADGFPLLVTNAASLAELNSRLENSVDMRHFRPNIVVDGADPWSEDSWTSLTIGKVSIDLVKPCSRCVMTTVNPDNGEKASDQQPLRTLGKYRRTSEGVIFGMNGVHRQNQILSVSDPVILT